MRAFLFWGRDNVNKAARNERRKITATYTNAVASATIAVGILAPLAAMFYGGASSTVGGVNFVSGFAVCIVASLGLHWSARRFLKGVEE